MTMSRISKMIPKFNIGHKKALSPTKVIALAFAFIILIGALLLTLPAASRSGVSCGFRPALFTATSATCVTGLVLYDTWSQWSGFCPSSRSAAWASCPPRRYLCSSCEKKWV